jgi:hypothetical protein
MTGTGFLATSGDIGMGALVGKFIKAGPGSRWRPLLQDDWVFLNYSMVLFLN